MIRTITYKLYPNSTQQKRLLEVLELNRVLYNVGLDHRIQNYRHQYKQHISYFTQCKELTELRASFPEFKALNATCSNNTLLRLDRAFKDFYARLKNKQKTGFPRFKSRNRFHSWVYEYPENGCKFLSNRKIKLQEVGAISFRGDLAYFDCKVKTVTILLKNNKWYALVVYDIPQEKSKREAGNQAFGLDWGVSTFATLCSDQDEIVEYENPRFLQKAQKQIKYHQRSVSRKKLGSKNRKHAVRKLANKHAKVARQRKAYCHKVSSEIVSRSALIAVEKLDVKPMTKKGTYKGKRTLNRNVLDTTPGQFHEMLKYKAEEAGIFYIEIDTRKYKPTQTCSECFAQEKKTLSERTHNCKKCGYINGRDINASRTILRVAMLDYLEQAEKDRLVALLQQNSLKRAMCGNVSLGNVNEALSNC